MFITDFHLGQGVLIVDAAALSIADVPASAFSVGTQIDFFRAIYGPDLPPQPQSSTIFHQSAQQLAVNVHQWSQRLTLLATQEFSQPSIPLSGIMLLPHNGLLQSNSHTLSIPELIQTHVPAPRVMVSPDDGPLPPKPN